MATERELLRTLVFSCYDLQELRIQMGLRLCANFRSKLSPTTGPVADEELDEDALKVIDQLKTSFTRLTDGVAKNRTLPSQKGFHGDELITTYTELVLVSQYINIERNERQQFSHLEGVLNEIPIYTTYLQHVRGVGPAMAAVLIAYLDPYKAEHPSAFWAYIGIDVADDGRGRSKRAEHLVDRTYTKADGTEGTKKSVTYQPWLKARLLGVLAGSFMRVGENPWRDVYNGYKHRLLTDPERNRVTLAEYKRAHKAGEDTTQMWPPLRIHRAALRYMIKQFVLDLWREWRKLEGLEVGPTYAEAKLGQAPHGGTKAA